MFQTSDSLSWNSVNHAVCVCNFEWKIQKFISPHVSKQFLWSFFSFVCLDNLYKVHRCAWIRDSDYDVTIVITENACPQNLHGEYFHLWQWSRSNSNNERKQRTAMVLTNKRKKKDHENCTETCGEMNFWRFCLNRIFSSCFGSPPRHWRYSATNRSIHTNFFFICPLEPQHSNDCL